MSDEPSLRRQWILLKALSSRRLGLTVRAMAREFGVSEKTIRRDLALFRSLGFPIEEAVGDFGRKTWRIVAANDQPPLAFSYDEAAALYLGRRLLDPLAGTAFGDAARRASDKVRATLGPSALDYLDRFADLFHPTAVGVHDYSERSDLIDGLQVAIEDGKATRLTYQSERADRPTAREVHPYGLLYHRGALYLIALDPRDERVKHFKVDRIRDAEILAQTFARPPDFDPGAHLATSFGAYQRDGMPVAVKVRFSPSAARYVSESRWHAGQQLVSQPDGGVLAEFRLTSTEELKRWVMSFGARAEILEPESLRREVAQELRAVVSAYEPSGPADAVHPHPVREAPREPRRPRERSATHAHD